MKGTIKWVLTYESLYVGECNRDMYVLGCKNKNSITTPAGFEPAPSKRNRWIWGWEPLILICRRNHLAIAPSTLAIPVRHRYA